MIRGMLRSVLVAVFAAGCSTLPPSVDCTDVPLTECEAAVKAALPLLSASPDRLVVAGSAPAFVVVVCDDASAVVVDVLDTKDSDIDARLREHGPNISHLCTPNPMP